MILKYGMRATFGNIRFLDDQTVIKVLVKSALTLGCAGGGRTAHMLSIPVCTQPGKSRTSPHPTTTTDFPERSCDASRPLIVSKMHGLCAALPRSMDSGEMQARVVDPMLNFAFEAVAASVERAEGKVRRCPTHISIG